MREDCRRQCDPTFLFPPCLDDGWGSLEFLLPHGNLKANLPYLLTCEDGFIDSYLWHKQTNYKKESSRSLQLADSLNCWKKSIRPPQTSATRSSGNSPWQLMFHLLSRWFLRQVTFENNRTRTFPNAPRDVCRWTDKPGRHTSTRQLPAQNAFSTGAARLLQTINLIRVRSLPGRQQEQTLPKNESFSKVRRSFMKTEFVTQFSIVWADN